MPRVVRFEIHADEPERAMKFYRRLFDWRFDKHETFPYWLITTGQDGTAGINGGLMQRHGDIDGEAVTAYVCSVGVDDIDAAVVTAEAAGGRIVVEKHAVPGIGWNACARDTEGNIFGMFQGDKAAR